MSTKKKVKDLKERFDEGCMDLIDIFCKKQDITFDCWIADAVGGVAVFNDIYFISLSDILYDVTTFQDKGLILQWHDYNMNVSREEYINYRSYIKRLRYEDLKREDPHK